jgi:phosphoenolpyruvate-protein phosphotransferase (PTS system enzyme I)
MEHRFKGNPVASGIAIGKTVHFARPVGKAGERESVSRGPEEEVTRYRGAVEESVRDIERLRFRLEAEGAVEGAAILDCHLQIMQDPLLTTEIETQIRNRGQDAAQLFREAMDRYEVQFSQVSDAFFRERLNDVRDVANRIFSRLQSTPVEPLSALPDGSVVFADELFPSDTASAGGVAALVTRTGGATSHLAIMAKSLGIPYVSGIDFSEAPPHSSVIVDGRTGEVIFNPSESTLSKYRASVQSLREQRSRLERENLGPAQTLDGTPIRVCANIQMIQELDELHRTGGSGVGLFRSEYFFLSNEVFPTEEEQLPIYRELVMRAKGLPVVIRTFDVGGDKFDRLPRLKKSDHPFLSSRSIRFMLDHCAAFKAQLRAILRAGAEGDVRILFPMVSDLAELLEAKRCVEEAKAELREEGLPFREDIPVGCMIEIPSAALTADRMAESSDFLSIGTNDLVQYTLAVDRASEEAVQGIALAHPALVRLVDMVVRGAGSTPVSLCGEMASDPRFVALLIGLGIREFSVSPTSVPLIKSVVRRTSVVSAQQLAASLLESGTHGDAMDRLIQHYRSESREAGQSL